MPEILADQEPDPPELRIKSADLVASSKEASLLKKAIGGQVRLAVTVDKFSF